MESLPDHVKLLHPGRGALLEDVKAQARDTGLTHRVLFPGFVTDIPGLAGRVGHRRVLQPLRGSAFQHHGGHGRRFAGGGQRCKGPHRPDNAGRDSLLCPYDDAAAFAAAILRLTEDSALRAQMGRAGKAQVQRYRLDAVLPQVMALYLSAAKETNT